MSSLSSKDGPAYRNSSGEIRAYETIGVDKLTRSSRGIKGVNLADPLSNSALDEITGAGGKSGGIHPRPEHHAAAATSLRPAVRRTARPSAAPHETGGAALMKIYATRIHACQWRGCTPTCPATSSRDGLDPYIKQCPPHGGAPLFASMYAAV